MYGPTGVGFLYGKRALLEEMPPYQGGGEMIKEVSFEQSTYNEIPFKFEAGTPNIADIIAFEKAIEFLNGIGKKNISKYEKQLTDYTLSQLERVEEVQLVGTTHNRVSVISFNLKGMHPFDLGMMLDAKGIAVRTGHHCTMPLMTKYKIDGTARASFAIYNSLEEVDIFVENIIRIAKRVRK
jgi:cysteine desulfurase/selenocysteine lyase